MPYSHSVLSSAILVAIAGIVVWLWKKSARLTVIIMLACASHILLDIVTHSKDLPLGFTYKHVLGFGLYSPIPSPLSCSSLALGFLLVVLPGRESIVLDNPGVQSCQYLLVFSTDTGFGRLSRQPANGHHDAYFCADCCDACAGGLAGDAQTAVGQRMKQFYVIALPAISRWRIPAPLPAIQNVWPFVFLRKKDPPGVLAGSSR